MNSDNLHKFEFFMEIGIWNIGFQKSIFSDSGTDTELDHSRKF